MFVFFFKQKTAYEMRTSDWSSDVCSSDLRGQGGGGSLPEQVGQPFRCLGCQRDWRTAHHLRTSDHGEVDPAAKHAGSGKRRGHAGRTSKHGRECGDVRIELGVEPDLSRRSEEHTSELQSIMRNSYAVFCLQKKI